MSALRIPPLPTPLLKPSAPEVVRSRLLPVALVPAPVRRTVWERIKAFFL